MRTLQTTIITKEVLRDVEGGRECFWSKVNVFRDVRREVSGFLTEVFQTTDIATTVEPTASRAVVDRFIFDVSDA